MMLLIIAVVLIFISILVLFLLSWLYHTSSPVSDIYPTIHYPCHNDSLCDGIFCVKNCGGDLICDTVSHKCKKKIDGTCSSTVDCQTGLICSDWKCISDTGINVDNPPVILNSSSSQKHVRWTEHNEIFHIPSRISSQ